MMSRNKSMASADQLGAYIERVEKLEDEKSAIQAGIRDVYSEAKADGFDAKIMRQIVRLRRLDEGDREEEEHTLDLYKRALGMEGGAE